MVNEDLKRAEKLFNSFIGQEINIWQESTISIPVLTFDSFNWEHQERENLDDCLVLYNGENRISINVDEIHNINNDELMNEVVIYMNNDILLQVWKDIQ